MGQMDHIGEAFDTLPALEPADMTPCVGCSADLRDSDRPLFYRFGVKRIAIDPRYDLQGRGTFQVFDAMVGGFVRAKLLTRPDPARILDSFEQVNVCHACMARLTVLELVLLTMSHITVERGEPI